MTLTEAKTLLDTNGIRYSESHFNCIAEFESHISSFTFPDSIEECASAILTVASSNNYRNIELLFIDEEHEGDYFFYDLYFGQYCYELFDYFEEDEDQPQLLIDHINQIISNNTAVIIRNDLSRKIWDGDAIFEKNIASELQAFEKAKRRIQTKKGIIGKLFGIKTQYEIYDWNTYQCIIK